MRRVAKEDLIEVLKELRPHIARLATEEARGNYRRPESLRRYKMLQMLERVDRVIEKEESDD